MKRQKMPISSHRVHMSCGRVAWASLAPFLAAVLLGSLYFRASGGSSSSREAVVQRHAARVLEETQRPAACPGGNCGGREGGADAASAGAASGGGGSGGAAVADPAAASGSPLAAAAAAATETAAGAAAVPGELPKLFLFIGILSGRGYRHRRLAVREAWANQAQIPGQVVAKFILSEDERTPQVGGGGACRQAFLSNRAGRCAECRCCWHRLCPQCWDLTASVLDMAPRLLPHLLAHRRSRRSWRHMETLCLCGRRRITSLSFTRRFT